MLIHLAAVSFLSFTPSSEVRSEIIRQIGEAHSQIGPLNHIIILDYSQDMSETNKALLDKFNSWRGETDVPTELNEYLQFNAGLTPIDHDSLLK
jgi:hypothetical protein